MPLAVTFSGLSMIRSVRSAQSAAILTPLTVSYGMVEWFKREAAEVRLSDKNALKVPDKPAAFASA